MAQYFQATIASKSGLPIIDCTTYAYVVQLLFFNLPCLLGSY